MITKLKAAECQLVTALRLFFDDGDPISVYTLANAARGIIHGLSERAGVNDFVSDAIAAGSIDSRQELYRRANKHANWFKHADVDPESVLADFTDHTNDALLWVACHDFGRLAGEMAIEMQIYEVWFFANYPDKAAKVFETRGLLTSCFPDIERASRAEQKAMMRKVLAWAKDNSLPRRPLA